MPLQSEKNFLSSYHVLGAQGSVREDKIKFVFSRNSLWDGETDINKQYQVLINSMIKYKAGSKAEGFEEVTVIQQYEWSKGLKEVNISKQSMPDGEKSKSAKTSSHSKQASESGVEWAKDCGRKYVWRVRLEPFHVWLTLGMNRLAF